MVAQWITLSVLQVWKFCLCLSHVVWVLLFPTVQRLILQEKTWNRSFGATIMAAHCSQSSAWIKYWDQTYTLFCDEIFTCDRTSFSVFDLNKILLKQVVLFRLHMVMKSLPSKVFSVGHVFPLLNWCKTSECGRWLILVLNFPTEMFQNVFQMLLSGRTTAATSGPTLRVCFNTADRNRWHPADDKSD